MKFVKDWRTRMFHFSTIALATGSAAIGLWVLMPEDMKSRLSPQTLDWTARVIFGVLVWGTVGKFIAQPKRVPDDSPKEPK